MLKTVSKTLAIILSLFIALVAALFIFIDPNEFKSDIEEQAKKHGKINLKIQGDIGWSLFPLGIDLNEIAILDQDLQPFSRFNKLLLEIETSSLFALAPKVDTVLLDGLDLDLIRNASGKANWENLLPPSEETSSEPADKPEGTTTQTTSQEGSSINFSVNTISISNVSLRYNDIPAGQDIQLKNLNLLLSNIGLGTAFPLRLEYQINNKEPQANIKNEINTLLTLSPDFSKIDITKLVSKLDINSELFKGNTVNLEFGGDITLNTKSEAINIKGFYLALNPLRIETSLAINNYSDSLSVKGDLAVLPFSVPNLMNTLGQPFPKLTSPEALTKVGLSTDILLKDQLLSLSKLALNMDETNWTGEVSTHLDTQASKISLAGSTLIADAYLPASSEETASDSEVTSSKESAQTVSTNENDPLLPLDTLRSLDLDILFTQKSIGVKGVNADNIKIVFKAKDGHLNLEEASLDALEGRVNAKASIDARTDIVQWRGEAILEKLNALESLQDQEMFGYTIGGRGILNANAGFNSLGNSIASLKKHAKAKAEFEIEDGALTGVNLNELACKGYAELGSKKVTKSDWPEETRFKALRGSVFLEGDLIRSPELTVENIGLRANGRGKVNLAKNELLYLLDITPTEDLGDEACKLRDKFQGIAIPIKCEGTLDTPPASLCKPDYSKLGDITAQIAKNEAKRKANKEIDRAVDKYLGEDDKTGLGDALKKGLNKWFK